MWRSAPSHTPASIHGKATGIGTVSARTCSFSSDSPSHSLQFIQPPGSLPSEVLHLALPTSCRPWLPALAWYLRQNLLIFLHSPKYTDSNSRNHFQVRVHLPLSTPTCTQASLLHTHTPLLCNCFLQMPHMYLCPHTVYTHGPHTPLLPTCVLLCSCVCLSPIPHCGHLFPDGFSPFA